MRRVWQLLGGRGGRQRGRRTLCRQRGSELPQGKQSRYAPYRTRLRSGPRPRSRSPCSGVAPPPPCRAARLQHLARALAVGGGDDGGVHVQEAAVLSQGRATCAGRGVRRRQERGAVGPMRAPCAHGGSAEARAAARAACSHRQLRHKQAVKERRAWKNLWVAYARALRMRATAPIVLVLQPRSAPGQRQGGGVRAWERPPCM